MKIIDLIKFLQNLNPNGEACIVDYDQNNVFEIVELRTCDDRGSDWYREYVDIVIDCEAESEYKELLLEANIGNW